LFRWNLRKQQQLQAGGTITWYTRHFQELVTSPTQTLVWVQEHFMLIFWRNLFTTRTPVILTINAAPAHDHLVNRVYSDGTTTQTPASGNWLSSADAAQLAGYLRDFACWWVTRTVCAIF
jgi:hypothetical protein